MAPADPPSPLGGGSQQQDDASPQPNEIASPASSSSPAPAPAPAIPMSLVDNMAQVSSLDPTLQTNPAICHLPSALWEFLADHVPCSTERSRP
jgi:hypothetical protein